eukprot:CAMPEP_0182864282 /NCGR_PEP_ID=MMETSP0034_2-20130328/7092_1 /TAXON_ID=156128 /ORGANISM="Nephroselmis pyriformis, Strain CCMP717" /LENGTH=38 /DNA_ID= /DNA_START= /DNA_END= /DNA_ORIENTATION=
MDKLPPGHDMDFHDHHYAMKAMPPAFWGGGNADRHDQH